jgi:hypothetical protein
MKTVYSIIIDDRIIIIIAGIGILCIALFILFRLFKWLSGLTGMNFLQSFRRKDKLASKEMDGPEVPADHCAAMAMALYLFNKVHDEESNILTIERKSRYYSPWSSKYYNMRKPIHYYRK